MKSLSYYLTHLFTPHHSNNHRAKALHPQSFIFYIFLLIVVHSALNLLSFARPDILGFATNINIDNLLILTNKERQDNHLQVLTINPELSAAAYKKAQDMFAHDYWAHNSPLGTTPWDFIKESGYTYIYAGENLAKDFQNSADVVKAWMDSPSHRENVLRSEYKDIGFAVVNGMLNGEETTLVVQMFGTPLAKTVAEKEPEMPVSKPKVQVQAKSPNYALGVVDKPLFQVNDIMRYLSLFLMGGLLTVVSLDGFLILKRKTVRIAGHNLAHFIFITALFGLVILSANGKII